MPSKKPHNIPPAGPAVPQNVNAYRSTLQEVVNKAVANTVYEFHPAYFTIAFRTEAAVVEWPAAFVIISAFATTGESWSAARNAEADERLHAELLRRGHAPIRITGYDPATGHGEPSWAVALPLDEALELGRDFLQDAIFEVQGDQLAVVRCAAPIARLCVGTFRERTQITV
ncbi:MAG: DUF3293 domain-containing protein [Flavobacteriales bacterium]|nr:DUF3293 domain-containing protein [Flavobacteriales bacterium]